MPSIQQYHAFRRELDTDELIRLAKKQSGLSNFGDETFIVPLDKQLDLLSRDASFSPAGLKEYREEVVRDLVNRLRFAEDLRQHPQILDEDVSDPIVILGLPRSGTTKTQRMLAADPGLLKTYAWQLVNPSPLPSAVPGRPDPRIAAALGDSLYEKEDPEVDAAHYMAADQVEEDWRVFSYCFNDWYPFMRSPSRLWHQWAMEYGDAIGVDNYGYARRIFQYLQWQQGGRRNRRWLMKSCGHLAHLEALVGAFPNATLVHVHRHPASSAPSFAKVVADVGSFRAADIDRKAVGEMVVEWASVSLARYMEARGRLKLNNRIIDVPYEQIRTSPVPVFKTIYRHAGLELTADAEQAMLQWQRDNEQGKHGKHSYSLEMFGMSEKLIEEAFGGYIQRFVG